MKLNRNPFEQMSQAEWDDIIIRTMLLKTLRLLGILNRNEKWTAEAEL
jgi:hypothetical protein